MSTKPTYSGIGDAGGMLVEVLQSEIEQHFDLEKGGVSLAAPDEVSGQTRISVFLYQVTENDHLRNTDWRGDAGDEANGEVAGELPLVLDLHYLLTVHPKQGGQGGGASTQTATTTGQHELLGLAMQVLHEHSILRGSDLSESFVGRELQISVESRSTDELTNIWSTFQDQPFRPSVAYRVTPVIIESTESPDGHRVKERRIEEYA